MSADLRIHELGKVHDNYFGYLLIFIPKVIVNEENAHDTQDFLTKRLSAIKNQRSTGELEDLALVIGKFFCEVCASSALTYEFADGKSLGFALQKDMSKVFLELAIMCKAVICCKSTVPANRRTCVLNVL